MAVLLGTFDADMVRGTETADLITALSGDDTVLGLAGADVIDAGLGNDTVYANDRQLWSDGAIDTVLGGAGDDHIYGGYGDILNGGTGFDLLSLDLSGADHGIAVNFRPMTVAEVPDLVTVKIDATELSGFQAVTEIHGSAFGDRIIVGNQHRIGTVVDAGDGADRVRATYGDDALSGDAGDDRLRGLRGRDSLVGGDGSDKLAGGRSQDMLSGGAGADRFLFNEGDTPLARGHADQVTDFSQADGDRLLLRGIDAIAGGDDDRFSFIGSDRFSGNAGELRFAVVGDSTFVSGDTDGDGRADFTIRLDGQIDLVQADFQL